LAVAHYNYCFTYIDVGCNVIVSDGGVFQNCSLYTALENGLLPEGHRLVGGDVLPRVYRSYHLSFRMHSKARNTTIVTQCLFNTRKYAEFSFRGNGVAIRSRQHLNYHRNIRKHNAYRSIQRGNTEKAF
jgi:hypothetical protein